MLHLASKHRLRYVGLASGDPLAISAWLALLSGRAFFELRCPFGGDTQKNEVTMISVSLIPWQPMELLPEDRKDGRRLLLWNQLGTSVAAWDNTEGAQGWCLAFGGLPAGKFPVVAPSYWSDINPPV
ncbi:hypothetical protein [Sphingobium scionense]|jgi:hypothetical protein|uniref:Uncharacterized protein n=1 Tax=Sphingobium scionense TaxID=1404341 RepID=A0A7W6LUI7_9SPHN|nr:hypothetical protein [Sphingobium scionense]MBB4150738.1 hypothetical protein [Sphingobium scionense]